MSREAVSRTLHLERPSGSITFQEIRGNCCNWFFFFPLKCCIFKSQARDDIRCVWEGPLSSSALILTSFCFSPPVTRSIISWKTSVLVMMEACLFFLWLEQCWPRFPGPIPTQVIRLCPPLLTYTSGRLHWIHEIPKLYLNANAKLIVSSSIGILPLFFS